VATLRGYIDVIPVPDFLSGTLKPKAGDYPVLYEATNAPNGLAPNEANNAP